jgi:hypothetical protein
MKRIILSLIVLIPLITFSQEKNKVISQSTVKRVSVGAEIFQDFWLNKPDDMDGRAINQGAGAFFTYSIPFGNSPISFALGAGVGWHNLYSDTRILNIKADTIVFTPIHDSIDYKKSKIGVTYLDFPIEFRLKTKNNIRAAIGIKLSYVIDAKTKYKGDKLTGYQVIQKEKQISNIDKFQFGPQVRFGYSWFHIVCYYSVTQLFEKGKGPDISPISLGITFMPF